MSALTPALDAAFAGLNPTVFGAVSITLPGAQINLLDGAGYLSFGGRTYLGRDPVFGVLSACEDLNDGMGDDAPAVSLTLLPANDAAAATLASPDQQGSLVEIYVGAVDVASNAVIADPYLLGLYLLDVPTLNSTDGGRDLEYSLVSVLEPCFIDDEGQYLSPGRQRSIYANDSGLDDVTGVAETIYWGVDGINAGIAYGGGGANITNQLGIRTVSV